VPRSKRFHRAPTTPSMTTGTTHGYHWLEVDLALQDFVDACPDAIVNRYIVVTSIDSGIFEPSDADFSAGWTSNGDLAYSPQIGAAEEIPQGSIVSPCCPRFNEWYVFDSPVEPLGNLSHANFFVTEIARGTVFAFVNSCLRLSDSVYRGVELPFWQQMNWIEPAFYVSDGLEVLIFATRDEGLFLKVKDRLNEKFSEAEEAES